MLRKREALTVVTPIPNFIPRQFAINVLHSHNEVITINPLVVDYRAIASPPGTAADECDSDWYDIVERFKLIPGQAKPGSGIISFNGISRDVTFKGCFHNMPWGLQTHIKAPMSVDIRSTYCIASNQSGIEPAERLELGLESLGAPTDGLYLREDIDITCNIAMLSYVKTQLRTASKEMAQRIIKKAEQADAAVLRRMMEDAESHMPGFKGGSGLPAELPHELASKFQPSELAANSTPTRNHAGAVQASYSPNQGQQINKLGPVQSTLPPALSKEQIIPLELPGDLHHEPKELSN
ncbi:hypothetical protein G7Z17_g1976 [Cylindrodendrum hubeiense]|uniref:DUF7053 domain-containing protein n=1 Tax=Cylindrodendrum hubeiense TaxID=595255 RepID=A0A9P5HHG6_9HYPO|nr:hypothetical protein G7Z17_g1976 [Cylindrodendrum hubeiense]